MKSETSEVDVQASVRDFPQMSELKPEGMEKSGV